MTTLVQHSGPARPAPQPPRQPPAARPSPPSAQRALPSLLRTSLSRGRLEITSFFRDRESVIFTFSLPVILLVVFGEVFHGTIGSTGVAFRQYFTAGIIASGIMSATFVNVGASVAADRADGTLTRLAGTPMPPAAYFAGKAIGALAVAAAEAGLLLAVGAAAFGLRLPGTAGPLAHPRLGVRAGHRDLRRARPGPEQPAPQYPGLLGGVQPALPGAVVHLGRVLRVP